MKERLLISTHARLIFWDGEVPRVLFKHTDDKHLTFYGITWNEEEIYVAEVGPRHCHFHVLDKNLNRVGMLPISVKDPHQILWWDGKLYITSAHLDSVYIWDGDDLRQVIWLKPGEPRLHPNSIWCDGERFYVVEHRYREMPKRIRVFDLDFNVVDCIELTQEGFSVPNPRGCHNVYIENGTLYMCSPNVIVRHDLATGRSEPVPISDWALKARRVTGFARPPGKFIIGLQNVAIRSERGKGDSGFIVLNDDLEVLDVVPLRNAGGVNEIRAIDGPDLAHNGIRCPVLS